GTVRTFTVLFNRNVTVRFGPPLLLCRCLRGRCCAIRRLGLCSCWIGRARDRWLDGWCVPAVRDLYRMSSEVSDENDSKTKAQSLSQVPLQWVCKKSDTHQENTERQDKSF